MSWHLLYNFTGLLSEAVYISVFSFSISLSVSVWRLCFRLKRLSAICMFLLYHERNYLPDFLSIWYIILWTILENIITCGAVCMEVIVDWYKEEESEGSRIQWDKRPNTNLHPLLKRGDRKIYCETSKTSDQVSGSICQTCGSRRVGLWLFHNIAAGKKKKHCKSSCDHSKQACAAPAWNVKLLQVSQGECLWQAKPASWVHAGRSLCVFGFFLCSNLQGWQLFCMEKAELEKHVQQ